MKPIKIGILSQEKIRERVIAIASGKYKPKASEPKIWFTSMKSISEVLSDENRALLHVIRERKPQSVSLLAELTGRKQSNLSRTLNKMSQYGIVEMRKEKQFVRPIAKATEPKITPTITSPPIYFIGTLPINISNKHVEKSISTSYRR